MSEPIPAAADRTGINMPPNELVRRGDARPAPASPHDQALHLPGLAAFPEQAEPSGLLQRLLGRLGGAYGGLDASRLQLSFRAAATDSSNTIEQTGAAAAVGQPGAGGASTPAVRAADGLLVPELSGEALAEGRAAEVAERHRLLTSSVDIRELAGSLERGLPFVLLLLLVFVARHAIGLLSFGWLTYGLYLHNKGVRHQVSLKAQRQPGQLAVAAGLVIVNIVLSCHVTAKQKIWLHLLLVTSEPPLKEFWDVVFAVIVADACMRFVGVLAKVLVLLVDRSSTSQEFRRRSHVLTAVEYCVALYRGLLPVPIWYNYFRELSPVYVGTTCSGVYILLKCTNIYDRLAAAGVAVRQAWQQSAYGSTPSAEEIAEAGNSCPICQEALRMPIKLQCGHLFCDDCVSEWFERERTCPMCRAAIRPPNLKSYGDGYTPLMPLVF